MANQIHFITALSNADKVAERIRDLITENDDIYELAKDKWFVVYEGISRDLAEKIGIRGDENLVGTGLVIPVNGYSGRAPTSLWEWLSLKSK